MNQKKTKQLTEAEILCVIREEWQKKINSLTEAVDVVFNAKTKDGEEKLLLSPELKVRHKKSGILYTIDSIGPRDVILRTPETDKFLVDKDQFESCYELD